MLAGAGRPLSLILCSLLTLSPALGLYVGSPGQLWPSGTHSNVAQNTSHKFNETTETEKTGLKPLHHHSYPNSKGNYSKEAEVNHPDVIIKEEVSESPTNDTKVKSPYDPDVLKGNTLDEQNNKQTDNSNSLTENIKAPEDTLVAKENISVKNTGEKNSAEENLTNTDKTTGTPEESSQRPAEKFQDSDENAQKTEGNTKTKDSKPTHIKLNKPLEESWVHPLFFAALGVLLIMGWGWGVLRWDKLVLLVTGYGVVVLVVFVLAVCSDSGGATCGSGGVVVIGQDGNGFSDDHITILVLVSSRGWWKERSRYPEHLI